MTTWAQQPTIFEIVADRGLSVTWDHDGQDTESYALLVDGLPTLTVPVSALVGTSVTVQLPMGLPRGNHTLVAVAQNIDASAAGAELQVIARLPPPSAPSQPRVTTTTTTVTVHPDGSYLVRVEQTEPILGMTSTAP